jgi:hypothetical protein
LSSKFIDADGFELRSAFDATDVFGHDHEHIRSRETRHRARSLIRQDLRARPIRTSLKGCPDELFTPRRSFDVAFDLQDLPMGQGMRVALKCT